MSLSWAGLPEAVDPGDVLYLADGAVRLTATAVRVGEREVDTEVVVGGTVASRQGLNIPGPADMLPSVPEEDFAHLEAGNRIGVDLVALSFVRRPEDVLTVREHTRVPLIAKIEKPQAVANAAEIVRVSDCVMVARGDLGIELPIEEVPMVQKGLIALAGRFARPVITATQMLDSMVTSSRPTRAEVADVANAILDGTDAVMLSQETAVGHHPVGAISMMAAIARHTERHAPYELWTDERVSRDGRDPSYTVAHAACQAARELELEALVVPTLSGRSARLVSAHRPNVPDLRPVARPRDRAPVRADVGRARRLDPAPRDHRGAHRPRRPAHRRARLGAAGRPRGDHRGAAVGPSGVDVAVPGAGRARPREPSRLAAITPATAIATSTAIAAIATGSVRSSMLPPSAA